MFIVLEGPGFSGKTTLAQAVITALQQQNKKVKEIRFPSDHPLGTFVRATTRKQVQVEEQAMAYLFIADMLDAQKEIQELISEDIVVISDRYFYSTMVYQRHNYSLEQLANLVAISHIPVPDLVVFLDLPLETLQKRMGERGSDGDKYDEIPVERVRHYQTLYRQAFQVEIIKPNRLITIEEETPLEALVSLVLKAIP